MKSGQRAAELSRQRAHGAGAFTLFLGGGIADALFAGAVGAMVCWMQRKVMPVFRNGAFFQLLTGLLAGAVICLAGRLSDVFAVDKMSIGVIMLLIPGAALTNAVRDMLVGHTISGLAAAGGIAAAGADAGHRVRQRDLSVWSVRVWH